jgi:hypothetical protein
MTQIALVMWLGAQGLGHKTYGVRPYTLYLTPLIICLTPYAFGLFKYHPKSIIKNSHKW